MIPYAWGAVSGGAIAASHAVADRVFHIADGAGGNTSFQSYLGSAIAPLITALGAIGVAYLTTRNRQYRDDRAPRPHRRRPSKPAPPLPKSRAELEAMKAKINAALSGEGGATDDTGDDA